MNRPGPCDHRDDIAALNAPTLVLAGSAEVKVLEGVGHLGLIKSADTRGAIQQWLTGPVRRD